jgi:hypothetical protein
MDMDDEKITIVEGPPPTFLEVSDGWPLGLNESPILANLMVTQLRTFNGLALVERCQRAWSKQQTVHLEYKNFDGLKQEAPIVAARHVDSPEGQLLILWVRMVQDETELELEYGDDDDDDDDDTDNLLE